MEQINISEEQLKVYEGLMNVKMKIRITWFILGGFTAVLVTLILLSTCIESNWQTKTILAVFDAILARTMYPLVNHFFPALKAASK